MNILVACKIVPDDQDVKTGSDGSLDFSRAHQVVSTYDLNAIEAAALLAEANPGSTVKAISVGSAKADDSKTKKNILARGVDELFLVADDAVAGLDAFGTAAELACLAGLRGHSATSRQVSRLQPLCLTAVLPVFMPRQAVSGSA